MLVTNVSSVIVMIRSLYYLCHGSDKWHVDSFLVNRVDEVIVFMVLDFNAVSQVLP